MERIVGRAELWSDDSASSSSLEPEDLSNSRIPDAFEFIEAVVPSEDTDFDHSVSEDPDKEYEFRLFGTTKNGSTEQPHSGLQKIRLDSPLPSHAESGLLRAGRDRSYYFTAPLSAEGKENSESAALTGEEILVHSQRPWPGCAYPWKVVHLPVSALQKSSHSQNLHQFSKVINEDLPAKRKRAGKKHRIKLRQEHSKLKAQQDADKAAADDREAAEREKRTRRNREKKVKKKERDKAKKPAATLDPQTL